MGLFKSRKRAASPSPPPYRTTSWEDVLPAHPTPPVRRPTPPQQPQAQRSEARRDGQDYFSSMPLAADDLECATPVGENKPATPPPAYSEGDPTSYMPGGWGLASDNQAIGEQVVLDVGNLVSMAGSFLGSAASAFLAPQTQVVALPPVRRSHTTKSRPKQAAAINININTTPAPARPQLSRSQSTRQPPPKYHPQPQSKWKKTLIKMAT